MDQAKRICVGYSDRLSDLPSDLKDNILNHMLIRDAARTSQLSREWLSNWRSASKLVFDENFFNVIRRKHQSLGRYEFQLAISAVLLNHSGPIVKFHLHIPHTPNVLNHSIASWMLFLSKNGIQVLQVDNKNSTACSIPSCIPSCNTLTTLKLNGCILNLPNAFQCFHNLVELNLEDVSFISNMPTAIRLEAPMLEILHLTHSIGIEVGNISAPKLRTVFVENSGEVDWQWFESKRKLRVVQVVLCKLQKKTVDMKIFLSNIPGVGCLMLDGFSLKVLASPGTPALSWRLTDICLSNLMYDVEEIRSAAVLIGCCPNLMRLHIYFPPVEENVSEIVMELLQRYLGPSDRLDNIYKNMNLEKLRQVSIHNVKGLGAEYVFIKLLLGRSTNLEEMLLSITVGANRAAKIFNAISRFDRASRIVEIRHMN